MAFSNFSAVNVTTTVRALSPGEFDGDKYKRLKIISSLVVVGVFLLACGFGYLLYRKICRSRRADRHGVEAELELKASGGGGWKKSKREYFDQFGVDTNELTVNSMTAIIHDEDERKLIKMAAARGIGSGSQRSSGIECDASTSDSSRDTALPVQTINTGKRVFQVSKVSERSGLRTPPLPGERVVVRLHRGLANAAHSLQASDGKNYTLALIDKHSKTIHNIDLRNYRTRTRGGKSPFVAEGKTSPRKGHNGSTKRRMQNSSGDTSGQSSAGEMLHDSPDMVRKPQFNRSLELTNEDSSLTDHSNTSEEKYRRHSSSLSSKEGDDDTEDPTHNLLPKVEVAGESVVGTSDPYEG